MDTIFVESVTEWAGTVQAGVGRDTFFEKIAQCRVNTFRHTSLRQYNLTLLVILTKFSH